MTESDKKRYTVFQSAVSILKGEQPTVPYSVVEDTLFREITYGFHSEESRLEFLSLLLNTWMKMIVYNYKLDRVYSEYFRGMRHDSIIRELDKLAGFTDDWPNDINYTHTDYHVPEYLAIAEDIKIIMKERGWIIEED